MCRLLLLFFLVCLFNNAGSQPGKPDVSFGNKGWIKTPFFQGNSFSENATAVLPQPDGSHIVLLNTTRSLLVRVKQDGSLVSTYGSNGYSASVDAQFTKAVQQNDGKILVAGLSYSGTTADFALAGLNTKVI